MDSALRPRDIQARIRAGESIEDVAAAAGVPVQRIEPFAAPVLAERHHVAGLALTSPVRRRGESTSNRQLRTAATEALVARGVDPDDVIWDAALLGQRRWQVTASFVRQGREHDAIFVYDQLGRFSVAGNDDARWMIGESAASRPRTPSAPVAPAPAASTKKPADDELALLRVIQEPAENDGETTDAFTEGHLTEVNGVYDIVPNEDLEMDALYDMLASFDEDSVKIYAGLVSPNPPDDSGPLPEVLSPRTPSLPEAVEIEPSFHVDDQPATEPEQSADVDEANDADEVPQQPSLVDDEPDQPRKGRRQKRASVPSWDEIMFGSPRQGPEKR